MDQRMRHCMTSSWACTSLCTRVSPRALRLLNVNQYKEYTDRLEAVPSLKAGTATSSPNINGRDENASGLLESELLGKSREDHDIQDKKEETGQLRESARALAGELASDPDGLFLQSELFQFASQISSGRLRVEGNKVLQFVVNTHWFVPPSFFLRAVNDMVKRCSQVGSQYSRLYAFIARQRRPSRSRDHSLYTL